MGGRRTLPARFTSLLDQISVLAYAEDNPSSAHQIHFNESYPDGAIVANPTAKAQTYLAFRFGDQEF